MSAVSGGDEMRYVMEEWYPRPGWRARNLHANNGRVYDFWNYVDKQAMVEIDWGVNLVTAYFDGSAIYEGEEPLNREDAFRAVEDAAAAYIAEQRANDPYYAEMRPRPKP